MTQLIFCLAALASLFILVRTGVAAGVQDQARKRTMDLYERERFTATETKAILDRIHDMGIPMLFDLSKWTMADFFPELV